MNYLLFGLLVSIGFGIGKILTDILSEIVFTRLHANEVYQIICKKKEVQNRPIERRTKMPIGFYVDKTE